MFVALVTATGLAGCFQSQQALFPPETGIAPMPANFALIETDANDRIKLGPKGEVHLLEFVQQGKVYVSGGQVYTFSRIPDRGQYLVQVPYNENGKSGFRYVIVDHIIGRVIVRNFADTSDAAFVSILEKGGVRFTRNGLSFEFSDRASLTEAARLAILNQKLLAPNQYRILTNTAEATAAGEEVRAARAAMGIGPDPQRGGGAQPPAANATPTPASPPIVLPQPHHDALASARAQNGRAMTTETFLFLGGVASELLTRCGVPTDAAARAALALFVKSASERAALGGNYSDPSISNMMRQNMSGLAIFSAGVTFMRSLGCPRPAVDQLAREILEAVNRAQSGPGGGPSPFIQSCRGVFSMQQCACIGQVGQAVIPGIHQMNYDRSIIRRIIEGSPLVGLQIATVCGVQNY
jgi:hypothetical protein